MGRLKEWFYAILAAAGAVLGFFLFRRGKVEGAAEQTYTEAVKRIDADENRGDAKSLRDEALKGQE